MKDINLKELKDIMKISTIDKSYLREYLLYRRLFTKYIIEAIELKKYDKKLSDSQFGFKNVEKDEMDVYQYLSSDELKYFYIRNNFYIERLSDTERYILNQKEKNKEYCIDDETKRFIETTYPKIIFEDTGKDGKLYKAFYGPKTTKYMANNDSLVLGVRYNDYYSNGMSDSEWAELRNKQLKFIQAITDEIINEQRNKIITDLSIIKYNEFSIQFRDIKKSNKKDNEEER